MKRKRKMIIFIILLTILILILILILFLYDDRDKQVKKQDDILFFKQLTMTKDTRKKQTKETQVKTKEESKIVSFEADKEEQTKNRYFFSITNSKVQIKTIQLIETVDTKTLIKEKIAPGTKGSFVLDIIANEETDYQVEFESKNKKPQNLIFYQGQNGKKYWNIEEMKQELNGKIYPLEHKQIEIKWEWPYENQTDERMQKLQDMQDTIDGANLQVYQFDIYVSGE